MASMNLFPDDPLLASILSRGALSSGRQPKRPNFTPEQANDILSSALAGIMSGVQYAGETLDKPGRAMRSLLFDESGGFDPGGAQWSDLAHLIPFGDTFGWANPDDAPSPSAIREHYGLTAETGNPWIDVPANLATDVAIGVGTDPLTLLVGPGKALTRTGVEAMEAGSRVGQALSFSDEIAQAGKNAMLGTSPARYADEIRAGQRGLVGLKLPFAEHPFVTFGAGSEKAAAAADALNYSPLSPVPYVRQLFDTRVRGQAPWAQRATDLKFSKTLETSAEIIDKSLAIDKRIMDLSDEYDQFLKPWMDANPQASGALTGNLPLDRMDPGSLVRAIAELKANGQSMQQIVRDASQLAQTQAPNAVMEAARKFDEVALAAVQTKDGVFNFYRSMGGDASVLDDEFINQFPRRLSELMAQQMGKTKGKKAATDVWGAIQRNIRHIDGGTYKVNAMSMDPNITGWWESQAANINAANIPAAQKKALLAQAFKHGVRVRENIVAAQYGVPTAVQVFNKQGHPITINPARQFAAYLGRLPEGVLAEGLFSRSLTTDLMDYSLNMMRRANGLQAVHGLTQSVASDDVALGPTVAELFENMKINPTGLAKFVDDYAAAKGLNPADVNPAELYVPHAMSKAAERMMHYNTRPADTIGVVKAYDKALSLFKAGVYAPWPASHVRNWISGMWQNMVTAWRNPADAAFGLREATSALKGGGNREWLEAFKAYALHQGLQIDDWLGVKKALDSELPAGLGAAFKDYTLGTAKNALHPIKTIKNIATDAGSELGPVQGGRKIGELVEFVNRYSHFASLKKRGWTNAAAARSVKLAHFDYQDMTPLEREGMKRLVLFYNFTRKNLPLQLRALIDEPGGRTAQTIRAINSLREQKQHESEYIPNYLSEGLAIPLGSPQEGQQNFYISGEILPVEEAFNRFSVFGNKPDLKNIGESFGSMLAAPISYPIQAMQGRQWWSHRNIGDLYQTPTDDQNWNFILANSPAARALSFGRMATDERKTALQKLLNATVGGGRFTTVDIPKWMNIESREVLERMLEPSSAVLQGDYLFAPDPSKLTEEQIIQLSLLQQLQQENRKMNKERKAREGR